MQEKIALFGATGFIGKKLVSFFTQQGAELLLFSRQKKENHYYWNPSTEELNNSLLEGVDVVINLSGENIIGRWNAKKMREITQSRLESSRFLVTQLEKLQKPPKLYIAASATGFYGDKRNEILTEKSSQGEGFLARLCGEWEKCAQPLEKKMRVCSIRLGVVIGKEGGMLKKIIPLFKWGLGGKLGSGKQYMSWISIDDVASALQHVIEHQEIRGAINLTSPYPVTNEEFTKTLAKSLQRPAFLHLPEWLLYLLFGKAASSIFLSDLRVIPEILLQNGFHFHYPQINETITY